MRIYTIHRPAGAASATADAVLIKEGFCWPAFLFPVLWHLWHRQWWGLLAYAAAIAVLIGAGMLLGLAEPVSALLLLTFNVLAAWHANDWRRWRLECLGYRSDGVVAGAKLDDAERKLFHDERLRNGGVPQESAATGQNPRLPPSSLDPLMP